MTTTDRLTEQAERFIRLLQDQLATEQGGAEYIEGQIRGWEQALEMIKAETDQ